MTLRAAVKALLSRGFVESQGTRHRKFIHPGGRMVVLPYHLKHDRLYGGYIGDVKRALRGAQ